MSLTWIAADGAVWDLGAGQTVEALAGLAGTGMPTQDQTFVQSGVGHGATLARTRHAAREIPVPVRLDRVDVAAFATALDPDNGDGRLVYSNPDTGTDRVVTCRYASGMEIVHDLPRLRRPVLVFRTTTPDPFWNDVDDTVHTYAIGDLGLWMPFPPIAVITQDVLSSPTIVNDGDKEAWPVWTIAGPADSVALANTSTGRSLRVAQSVADGDTLTIDTRPGVKTVLDQDGMSAFALLDEINDDLFPLAVGTNTIDVSLEGATLSSSVSIAWRRRWLTG